MELISRVTRNPKLEVRGTVSQLRLFVGLAGVIAGAVCARARDVANLAQDGFTFHDGGLQVGNALIARLSKQTFDDGRPDDHGLCSKDAIRRLYPARGEHEVLRWLWWR